MPLPPLFTGIESTRICGSSAGAEPVDVMDLTGHTKCYQEDLSLVRASHISLIRCPIRWHEIERCRGTFDWTFTDGYLKCLRDLGIEPIVDLLHHTSFPDWLGDGFRDQSFVSSFVGFYRAFQERYPWVRKYTPINEPFVTAFFCGYTGDWYPHGESQEDFVQILRNFAEAYCLIASLVKAAGGEIVHVDSCEHHLAVDGQSERFVAERNELRFIFADLVLGRLLPGDFNYEYLAEVLPVEQLAWFQNHAATIDVFGLDFYAHSQICWAKGGTKRVALTEPWGFARIATGYYERYGLPLMLSETNIRDPHTDTQAVRLIWLRHMLEECERLTIKGIPLRGFCWFPWIDTVGWSGLVTEVTDVVDPQGIISLSRRSTGELELQRHTTTLTELFGRLARGELQSSRDIPVPNLNLADYGDAAPYACRMAHW